MFFAVDVFFLLAFQEHSFRVNDVLLFEEFGASALLEVGPVVEMLTMNSSVSLEPDPVVSTLATNDSSLTLELDPVVTTLLTPAVPSDSDFVVPTAVYIVFFVLGITAVLMVIFNGATIVAILRFPWLRTACNVFVLGLACSDLLVGSVALPALVAGFFGGGLINHSIVCNSLLGIGDATVFQSPVFLAFIAIERYVVVHHPLTYGQYVSRRFSTLITLVTSFSILLYALIQRMTGNGCMVIESSDIQRITVMGGLVVVSLLVATVCHLLTLRTALKARRVIHDQRQAVAADDIEGEKRRANLKLAATMFMVLGVFVLCWGLTLLLVIIGAILTRYRRGNGIIFVSAVFTASLNSLLNPIIYARREAGFRRAFMLLLPGCLKKIFKKKEESHSVATNKTALETDGSGTQASSERNDNEWPDGAAAATASRRLSYIWGRNIQLRQKRVSIDWKQITSVRELDTSLWHATRFFFLCIRTLYVL